MKNNIILEKSYAFALRIVKLCKYLQIEKREFVISKQIIRSGTSIGANAEEVDGGITKKDFIAKIQISYKEARETHYWLRLLRDSEILSEKIANSMIVDCEEILKIITAILKTSKENLHNNEK